MHKIRSLPRFVLLSAALAGAVVGEIVVPRAPLAQAMVRAIPAAAVPGMLEIKVFPMAVVDGEPVRLGAGARIRDLDNRIVTPASLSGTHRVLYSIDSGGLIHEVWLVTEAEFRAARNARKGK